MTMLVQRTAGSSALPFILADLKLHLRVSDEAEDAAITNIGKTAALEIEHFAQIALLCQTIEMTVVAPKLADRLLRLPIGPLDASVPLQFELDGVAFIDFTLCGGIRPAVFWHEDLAARAPQKMTITYQAGFGGSATDIPPDLAQALMDQAALHYDGRSPMDAKLLTNSPHMTRVAARYRGVQA